MFLSLTQLKKYRENNLIIIKQNTYKLIVVHQAHSSSFFLNLIASTFIQILVFGVFKYMRPRQVDKKSVSRQTN